MTQADVREALVLGGGPAGLLAARALSEIGIRVTLCQEGESGADAASSPARHHVHVLPDATMQLLERLMPGVGAALKAQCGTRRPDRTELDRLLADQCLPWVHRVVVGRVRTVDWAPLQVKRNAPQRVFCEVPNGSPISADILVDATGVRRLSFKGVAQAMGHPVPIDESAGAARYTSVCLHGVQVPTHDGFMAVRDADSGRAALLLAVDPLCARLTIVTPATQALANSDAMFSVLDDPEFQEIKLLCVAGVPAGRLSRWGPHPVARVVLEACERAPAGWFPLGDAALVTPPHLARGVAYAAEQVALLASGLDDNTPIMDLRARLAENTRMRWLDSVVLDSLSELLTIHE